MSTELELGMAVNWQTAKPGDSFQMVGWLNEWMTLCAATLWENGSDKLIFVTQNWFKLSKQKIGLSKVVKVTKKKDNVKGKLNHFDHRHCERHLMTLSSACNAHWLQV